MLPRCHAGADLTVPEVNGPGLMGLRSHTTRLPIPAAYRQLTRMTHAALRSRLGLGRAAGCLSRENPLTRVPSSRSSMLKLCQRS
jgi:hypothetical protein